ncbi:hypothetical protein KKF55_01650 [Patescibacteria group bacterium]|nr:hypothetical protein [Patescibacteria group bacterium]
MKRFSSALITLSLLVPVVAFAATFQAAKDDDKLFMVSVPVWDDLYVAGGLVQIKETIGGDLVIAGGEITITGNVEEDIIAGGGRITIDGNVGDDIRVVGGDIEIRGTVSDDLIVAGGTVRITEDAVINGDAIVAGGMLVIDGTIKGNITVGGGQVYLAGTVEGDALVDVESLQLNGEILGKAKIVSKEVTVQEGASIGGDLEYWSTEVDPYAGIVSGDTFMNPDLKRSKKVMSDKTFFGAAKVALIAYFGFTLLSAALIIFILVIATNKFPKEAAKLVDKKPWKSLFMGLAFFVITPFVALLFLISIIGAPIALLIFLIYGFAIFFAKALTAFIFASFISLYYKKKWGKVALFFVAIAFLVLLKLLTFVPIIGWIINLVFILIAFGALIQMKMDIWKKFA